MNRLSSRHGGRLSLLLGNSRGFTVVEMIVVVMIIMVLATVGMVSLSGARRKARDAHRVQDMQALADALQIYYTEFGAYPVCNFGGLEAILSPVYVREFPDPPNVGDYEYNNNCTGGTVAAQRYQMRAILEGSKYANNACSCSAVAEYNFCVCEGTCETVSF